MLRPFRLYGILSLCTVTNESRVASERESRNPHLGPCPRHKIKNLSRPPLPAQVTALPDPLESLCAHFDIARVGGKGGLNLTLIQWLRSEEPRCTLVDHFCSDAAALGQLDVLQWLRSRCCPWYWQVVCNLAAAKGGTSSRAPVGESLHRGRWDKIGTRMSVSPSHVVERVDSVAAVSAAEERRNGGAVRRSWGESCVAREPQLATVGRSLSGLVRVYTACVSRVESCRFRAAKCLGGRSAEFESKRLNIYRPSLTEVCFRVYRTIGCVGPCALSSGNLPLARSVHFC